MGQLVPVSKLEDRQKRMLTAGLSAVGGAAGAAGLGYAGYKMHDAGAPIFRAARAAGKGRLVSMKQGVKAAAKKEPFGTALLPLEAVGLGGEVAATRILHGDTKRQKQDMSKAETSKDRGLLEVAKAEEHLAKANYTPRPVRDPGSELDIIAAASLLLNAEHNQSKLPWRRRAQIREQLQAAIARGYLNAPYTTGR